MYKYKYRYYSQVAVLSIQYKYQFNYEIQVVIIHKLKYSHCTNNRIRSKHYWLSVPIWNFVPPNKHGTIRMQEIGKTQNMDGQLRASVSRRLQMLPAVVAACRCCLLWPAAGWPYVHLPCAYHSGRNAWLAWEYYHAVARRFCMSAKNCSYHNQ